MSMSFRMGLANLLFLKAGEPAKSRLSHQYIYTIAHRDHVSSDECAIVMG